LDVFELRADGPWGPKLRETTQNINGQIAQGPSALGYPCGINIKQNRNAKTVYFWWIAGGYREMPAAENDFKKTPFLGC